MKRLPAEWEKHESTWITWPCRLSIWPDYAKTCQAYADVVNAVAQCEPVNLIINPEQLNLAKKLCTAHQVNFIDSFSANDSWSRDTSPIFLTNDNQLIATCWQFNAWGNKFPDYALDAELSQKIAQYLAIKNTPKNMVLEGGSIHTNGEGTLLVTKECLLNKNRNPHLTQMEIEKQLKETLSINHIIWLENGLDGDVDTDGHIDNTACFVDKQSIMIQSCTDQDDPNYKNFIINKKILKASTIGNALTVHEIPQPPRSYIHGARVPLSYINFYFANDAIILPTFDTKKEDNYAEGMFKEIFPQRTIMPVSAWPILQGGGGIHCITMQQPKVTL
jgi:agmatine deiminase